MTGPGGGPGAPGGIDPSRVRALAQELLRWGHAHGGALGPTFWALRDGRPSVAIEFSVRPEHFPQATVQEIVHGLDPAAVGVLVEGTVSRADRRPALLANCLDLAPLPGGGRGTPSQRGLAWEITVSPLGVPAAVRALEVRSTSENLLSLARIPRAGLDDVPDPAEHFVPREGAERPSPEERRRVSLDVGALNRWAREDSPARRVVVLGTAGELELLQRNGLLPPVATIEVR